MFRPDSDRKIINARRSLLRMALEAHLSHDDEFIQGVDEELRKPILQIYATLDELLGLINSTGVITLKDSIARVVDELLTDGWSETAYNLVKQDYKDVPVTARTFLTNPYYAGEYGEALYPANFRDICWILNPKNRILELLLTGSTRWGKSSLAILCLAYRIYLVSLLHDPQSFFGIMRGSSLRYGIFNVFKNKTGELYQRISDVVDRSDYFKENFPRQGREGGRELKLPNHISLLEGARELDALGETLIGAMLDEVNFMKQATNKQKMAIAQESLGQAQRLYGAIRGRLRNQFISSPGTAAPYFMALLSQRRAQTDFLEQHIAEHGHEEGVCVISRAIWDVQPPGTYSGKKFYIFCGDSTGTPRILDYGEVEQYETANVIEAPEEHRVDADNNLEDFIRNIAGRATVAASVLFRMPESITRAHDENLRHPFSSEWVVLSTYSPFKLQDAVLKDVMFRVNSNRLEPRIHPRIPRIIHIDLASTECSAGMACTHMIEDGGKPVIYLDFCLRIDPPPKQKGDQIDLDKIVDFIIWLNGNGFNIQLASFDKYQSRHSMILLRKAGIECEFVSMDESEDPYLNLRDIYEAGWIKTYPYPTLETELRHLERDITMQKVYKPFNGSKDVSDGVCGSVYGHVPARRRVNKEKLHQQMPIGGPSNILAMTVGG